jgi:hypothetical protein
MLPITSCNFHLFVTKICLASSNERMINAIVFSSRRFAFGFFYFYCSTMKITHTSLSPIRRGFAPSFVNYKKGCTRLAAASDKVYQLLAHGQWFSPGTPSSSTTKTGLHDIVTLRIAAASRVHPIL